MADVAIGLASFTETDLASATTCDIGAATTLRVHITGTTTITSFGLSTNRIRFLRFSNILTLTHNAVSLILPSGASIVTAAGDTAMAVSGPSGGWRVTDYTRADGTPLVALALDSDLGAIAALTPSNDDVIQRKAGTWTNRTIAQLLSDLGLGSIYQPLDSDLTAIAGLSPSNDDVVQRKAGAWTNRTIAQVLADLGAVGKFPFPATQVASAGANDLDDYEEGSWTPALTFGGAAVGLTGTFVGSYTKVGQLVVAWGTATLTAKGSSVGVALFSGLPFTAAGITQNGTGRLQNMTSGVGDTMISYFVLASTTTFRIDKTSAGSSSQLSDPDFTNTSSTTFTLAFRV